MLQVKKASFAAVAFATACIAGAVRGGIVTDADDTSWWSLADGVLTLDNSDEDVSSSTNIYTATIGSDVTNIVKTGAGAVRLSGTNTDFAGSIDVQAGLLMGWVQEKFSSNFYTEDNYGAPSQVTVADGATFEMISTPMAATSYTESRFSATQFYVSGTGLNGMGALRRHSYQQTAERSYATLKKLTLLGPTMLWVGMRWGFTGSGCVLNQNGYALTLKNNCSSVWTFNFCRDGQLEMQNPGDIIADHTLICIENNVPKNNSASLFAGTYMVITNSGVYSWLAPTSATLGSYPLYWDILSYGGYIQGPNAGDAAKKQTATFAGDLTLCSGTTVLYDYTNTGEPHIALTGEVNGPGTLSTAADKSYNLNVDAVLTGGGEGHTNLFAKLTHQYGTLTLRDADRFTITNGATVGGSYKSGKFAATLVITNTSLFMQPGQNKPLLAVGNSSNTFGVVEVCAGGVVTNDMQFGAANGGAGALYIRDDAHVYWHGGGGSNPFLGILGCACMCIRDSAVFENLGYLNIGQNGGRSYVMQRGGTYRNVKSTVTGDPISGVAFKIGRMGGEGHYYQCGGTQTSSGHLNFTWDYPQSVYDSEGAYTVTGPGSTGEVNDVCYCITFAGTTNSSSTAGQASHGTDGTVNIKDGGTFVVNRMYKTVQEYSKDSVTWNWSNSKDIAPNSWAWLNFDGGIMKIKGDGEFFSSNGTADDARLPTRVTVYSGGATIDTGGNDSTWRLPLEKPYGLGVKSVTLPAGVITSTNYICPPRVVFSGDGSNVTAVVDFDETQRTNRGVIVTSAGFGFTSAPTVTVEKETCDKTYYSGATAETVDFDSDDYAHGGLTKRGAGTLTLVCTNTYGGATRIEGGALAFTAEGGMPGGDVELAAAALIAADGAAPLLSAVDYAGGALRVTEADSLDPDTWHGVKKVASFTQPLAALPEVAFVNADGTAAEPGAWTFSLTDDWCTVAFGYSRSTVIMVR